MSNTFSAATFSPALPINAVSEFEIKLLQLFGIEVEVNKDSITDAFYFYVPDGFKSLYLDDINIEYCCSNLVNNYANLNDPLALRLLETTNNLKHKGHSIASIISAFSSWTAIFQKILNKPSCKDIDYISCSGSYWSNKYLPDEFGGIYCVITKTGYQEIYGRAVIVELLEREQRKKDLITVVTFMEKLSIVDEELDSILYRLKEHIGNCCEFSDGYSIEELSGLFQPTEELNV